MNTIKLDTVELKGALLIMDSYKGVSKQIKEVEEAMKILENRKTKILEDLKQIKENEDRFVGSLSEKYGDGKIDPNTLDWIKTE
jgi:hypothetical protein